MDISAKMPAQQDPKGPSQSPAQVASDAPETGGGSEKAPAVAISLDTQRDSQVTWESTDGTGEDWQAVDEKTGPSDGYSLQDRKD